MKICSRCEEPKFSSAFQRDASKPDGLKYHCRDCDNKTREASTRGKEITLMDSAAVWATRKMKDDY